MPTLMRVKRFRVTPASSRTFWTDFLLSSAYGWPSSVASLKKPLRRPSTIFGRAASGLPSARVVSSATRRSDSTTSAGDVLLGEVLRREGGDVLGDALGDVGVRLVQLDENTDLRGQVGHRAVHVRGHEAVGELREAVQHDLLAEVGVGLVHERLDGLAGLDLGREQRIEVGRGGLGDVLGDRVGDGLELVTLGDEVRLALQLDEDAGGVVVGDDRDHGAVLGGAALTLGDALLALDPERLDGLVDAALGLVQRLLAVHHAGCR